MSDFIRCSICGKEMPAESFADINKPVCTTCMIRSMPPEPDDAPAPKPGATGEELKIDTYYPAREQAQIAVKKLGTALPPVVSAYAPSGAVSAEGLLTVLIGSGISLAASAAAALAVAILGISIIATLLLLLGWGFEHGHIHIGGAIVTGLLGIVTLVLIYVAAGAVAGFIGRASMRIGKNRNIVLAGCMSFFPALVGAGIAHELIHRGMLMFELGEPLAWCGNFFFDWQGWGALFGTVGCLLAGFLALGLILEDRSKFCEKCNRSMAKKDLPRITISDAKKAIAEMNNSCISAAAHIINSSQTGPLKKNGFAACQPTLYRCPRCHKGYLELDIIYKGMVGNKSDPGTFESKWLAGSWELDYKEADLIAGDTAEMARLGAYGRNIF